jgi:hypothetical protein
LRDTAGLWLLDLESTNGTLVNGVPAPDEPVWLKDGDVIGIGQVRVRYAAGGHAGPTDHTPSPTPDVPAACGDIDGDRALMVDAADAAPIAGKVALVSGGNSGIGGAAAVAFARKGARQVCIVREVSTMLQRIARRAVIAAALLLITACGQSQAGAPTAAPTRAPTAAPTRAPTTAPTVIATDSCTAVEHLDPTSSAAHAIGTAYVRSLPPDRDVGQIDRIYGVDRLGAWVVLEASFTQTEPGVSVLRREGTGYREIASWGGPVQHAHELQDYLSTQVPDAPQALLTCLRPKQAHFTYHQR